MSEEIITTDNTDVTEGAPKQLSMGTLYDFNKNMYDSANPMSPSKVRETLKDVSSYIRKTNNKYYMLLNHDLHYFSLFHITDADNYKASDKLANEVKAIFEEDLNAQIMDMNAEDNGTYEIWVRKTVEDTKQHYVFYLFPYDSGLIEIEVD